MSAGNDEERIPIQDQGNSIEINSAANEGRDAGADQPSATAVGQPFNETANVPDPPSTKRKSKRKCRECREWGKFAGEWLTFIAIITYVVINGRMYGQMVTGNNLTRESLESVQRAFVVYQDLGAIGFKDIRNNKRVTFLIHPIWMNVGKTPTRELRVFVSVPKSIQPPYRDLEFEAPPKNTAFTPMVIAPEGTIRGGDQRLSAQDLIDIQTGTKAFYIWGWARYRDIFPKTKSHTTRFCTVINGVFGDPSDLSKPIGLLTEFCPQYNCSDDECEEQDRATK